MHQMFRCIETFLTFLNFDQFFPYIRQVEAPQVYATVYAWLTGGSQFVNQADVGGVYNGQWIMATSRWVTKVYKPSEPLPRTGY